MAAFRSDRRCGSSTPQRPSRLNRRLRSLLLLPLLASGAAAGDAQAGVSKLSQLYVFGDSLSDSGNSFEISLDAGSFPPIFPPPPYAGGRFSNGLVAAEYLWQAFNPGDTSFRASLQGGTNFAVGGATTGEKNFIQFGDVAPTQALRDAYASKGNAWQLASFGNPAFDPERSLFLVWLFPNDPFTAEATGWQGVGTYQGDPSPNGVAAIVPTAVSNIIGTIEELADRGARNFLVPNTPDLGLIPEFIHTPAEEFFTDLTDSFNLALGSALQGLALSRPDLDIIPFQTDDLFAEVRSNPGAFGFSNVEQRCLTSVFVAPCATPDSYLFWDGSHPTTAGHAMIGNRFYQAAYEPVPGPLPLTGAAAALGWSRALRRRIRLRPQRTSRSCAGRYPAD
jgi:phospholipase/lecithinase/hemolysin